MSISRCKSNGGFLAGSPGSGRGIVGVAVLARAGSMSSGWSRIGVGGDSCQGGMLLGSDFWGWILVLGLVRLLVRVKG